MRMQCVELGMSFSYHPQIDGQTKAVWYACLNNSFQFFLSIHMGKKVYENTCNVV